MRPRKRAPRAARSPSGRLQPPSSCSDRATSARCYRRGSVARPSANDACRRSALSSRETLPCLRQSSAATGTRIHELVQGADPFFFLLRGCLRLFGSLAWTVDEDREPANGQQRNRYAPFKIIHAHDRRHHEKQVVESRERLLSDLEPGGRNESDRGSGNAA